MKDKLITLVVLPYTKAYILKMRLEAKKIECELENEQLIEGSGTSSVRVRILEGDLANALPELDFLMGLKSDSEETKIKATKRQILVPVDFSQASKKTVRLAFNIASHRKADLVLMHSYVSPVQYAIPYGDIYPFDSTMLVQTREIEQNTSSEFKNFMTEVSESIGKEKWEDLNVDYILKPGSASEDILAYAKEHHPRLIVIGRGDSLSGQGTVGSVTADVMYNAQVPVLIVPEEMEDKNIDEFSNVLYATNFDAKDFIALDKLMNLLRHFDLNLTCAHVGLPDRYGWDLARLEGMRDILQKKYSDKKFECKLIMGHDVLHALEDQLIKDEIDILALTTHKRNMISRLFNPSLAR
ncbi:MAG: universal stress protein, partial [Draconibacterium sp.]|nr:universal stress protein [Draconibacterium sp.]